MSIEEKLRQLKHQRKLTYKTVARFRKAFDSYDRSSSTGTLQLKLEKFKPVYEKFDHIQTEIESLIEGDDNDEEQAERENFEFSYFELLSEVNDYISKHKKQLKSVNEDSNSSRRRNSEIPIKLPNIHLPNFSRSGGIWMKLCKNSIDSNQPSSNIMENHSRLSEIETHQPLNPSHRTSPLEYKYSLMEQSEDRRSLVYSHVMKIFQLPIANAKSYLSLRRFIDDIFSNLFALKKLGEMIEFWDTLLIHLLAMKLDDQTKCEWDKKFFELSEHPKLKDFMYFLENKCEAVRRSYIDKPGVEQEQSVNHVELQGGITWFAAKNACQHCDCSNLLNSSEESRRFPGLPQIEMIPCQGKCFEMLQSDPHVSDIGSSPVLHNHIQQGGDKLNQIRFPNL